jgi:hypothetical protein
MAASYFMLSIGGNFMSNLDGINRTFFPLLGINKENISRILDVQRYIVRGRNLRLVTSNYSLPRR